MSSGYSDTFNSMSSEDTFSILNSTNGQMSPERTVVGARTEVDADDLPKAPGYDGPSLEAGLPSPPSSHSSSSSKSASRPSSRSKSAESQHSRVESEKSRSASQNSHQSSALRAKNADSLEEEEDNKSNAQSSKAPSSHRSNSPQSSAHSSSVSESSSSPHSSAGSSRSSSPHHDKPNDDVDASTTSPTTLERRAVGEEQPRIDSSGSESPGRTSVSPGAPASRSSSASLHSVAKSIDNSRMEEDEKSEAPKTTAKTKSGTNKDQSEPKKGTSSKVSDIRADDHQPSPVPKKSVPLKPGSAGVKALRVSPTTTNSPTRTSAAASGTTPQASPTGHHQEERERQFRSVPPSCRNILMGMVDANSDSDDSDDAFTAPRRPEATPKMDSADTPSSSSVAVIGCKSGDVREIDKAASQASTHYPRQPRVTSARQKYLNSIDMRFLVSAPLLGRGRVGKKLNPTDKAPVPPSASVSPRSTKSRPSTGNTKPTPKPSSSSPLPPQIIEDTAATPNMAGSIPAESPEWTVDNKAESTACPDKSTDKQRSNVVSTKPSGTLKKTAWRVIPLNYLSSVHEAAEQRRARRDAKLAEEKEQKEAAKKEQHAKVAAPSERLYSKGAVPKERMERYRELAREAGEDFAEEPESLTGTGADNDDGGAASKTPESGARMNAAKWVLTRTASPSSGGGKSTAPASGTQYDTTTQFLHLRPRENDEVFDRLSTIKKSKMNPYKDVQIGGKPLDPLSEDGLGELNERMYGRWVERKEKEKKVKEEKEAAAKAKPSKKVSAEEIAERMYAQPVEMRAKKLEVLRKKQEDEIKRLARTIDVGGKASPREAPATVSVKSVSQRQYYEPMAKKAAWRESMLKTLAEEDKKASVSKGPIDSTRWDDIIERNVYEVQAKRPPTAAAAIPAPPKSTPKKTGRTRPQTAQ